MGFKVVQSNPAAGTPADLYTVPSAKQAVISTLTVCNYGTAVAEYDLRVRPAGATAADVHFLAAGVAIPANETAFITAGIALGTADVVTVEADTASVTFMAFVSETDA
jgi:hypothetical protein